jgi:nucleotide-binding universal stress UspA family protein
MAALTKILLPVDYSGRCLAVTRQAVRLAEQFGSEITVLRVLAPVSDATPTTLDATERLRTTRRSAAATKLEKFACAELRHVRGRTCLREGDPAAEILSQAAEDGSDLIMMPTHGFSAFRRLLLGSVAARCLHEAVCPVWTGPYILGASKAERSIPGHIVCAIALGSGSSTGIEWAAKLAGAFHSELTILHLAPLGDLPPDGGYEHPWQCHALTENFAAIPRAGNAGIVSSQILVETSDVSKAVSFMAERLHAGLVVLDHGPREKAYLSTDAYEIIRDSTCSTLRV